MNLDAISAGKNPPHDINVVIEIPQGMGAIKYEIDKDSGALLVDRFLGTAMHYPANYGFVPHTLADDGDPVDVLVITHAPILAGAVVRVRPVAVLNMEDDGGMDQKIVAVPVSKLSPLYDKIKDIGDVEPLTLKQIEHFFQHYKDLEPGKWVKLHGWAGVAEAARLIEKGLKDGKAKAA
ncbi:MAG: inorganic diphosphatase [Alphaproteobacteria bacterium]|jgi:inorganic pyrophosphatase|nr:inorganic diphosphatase [Thalassospira sp.]MCE2964937.1 inorganic diphosphatase [Alphaproteobacteria bacterium]